MVMLVRFGTSSVVLISDQDSERSDGLRAEVSG